MVDGYYRTGRGLGGYGEVFRCKSYQSIAALVGVSERPVSGFYHLLEGILAGFKLAHDKNPFKRYVDIGKVALVNYGESYGKLVVIVDVIDQNRALVDAPDMVRSQMSFGRLSLTYIKIDIGRIPKKKVLIGAMEAADVKKKWERSSWGRKFIVQKKRASLNDFDRFKVMLAKIKRGKTARRELRKLKEVAARREGLE
ncbi:60S ribosomal protein L14-1-like [Papaver somniferum]|uniref:60S ribosomal protein L14-1-like n=1 Tax=Papaver somniferum TaxID=3469 RepID=UPI000E70141F|nr:60S ribosomal protein L14-1-like [Papaver somniferum]